MIKEELTSETVCRCSKMAVLSFNELAANFESSVIMVK